MTSTRNQDIPRQVAAAQGYQWLLTGFGLYRKNPLLLSAGFGALFGFTALLALIPLLGGALSELVSPLIAAGFMAAYRVLDQNRTLEWSHYLAGVRGPLIPLMTLGAVQLLGMLLIGQVMFKMGFDPQAVAAIARRSDASPQELQALMNQILQAALTGLALFAPLLMATWFAPALILFGGARPATALGISIKAALRNWAPMLVNSLVLGLLLMLAYVIPYGIGLLFAMPLLFASLYASYQAIFAVWADDTASD